MFRSLTFSAMLATASAFAGCNSQAPHAAAPTFATPPLVALHYEMQIPTDVPSVIELVGKDGDTRGDSGREMYASAYRDGWFECLDRHFAKKLEAGGEAKNVIRQEFGLTSRARGEGFNACLASLRAAGGERAKIEPPAWFERIDNYVDEEMHEKRREADDPDPALDFGDLAGKVDRDGPVSRVAAMSVLLRTQTFTDTAVGFELRIPIELKAFRTLFRQPDADAAFSDVLQRGQPAGQLYALCYLAIAKPDVFRLVVEDYRNDPRQVMTFSGCIRSTSTVGEVAESKQPNTVRLRPGQTIKEWSAGRKVDGAYSDILGGATPETIKSMIDGMENDAATNQPVAGDAGR